MIDKLTSMPRFIKEIFLLIIIVLVAFTIIISISMNELLEGVELKSLLSSKFDFVSSYKSIMGFNIAESTLTIEDIIEELIVKEKKEKAEMEDSLSKSAVANNIDIPLSTIDLSNIGVKQLPNPKKPTNTVNPKLEYIVIHYMAGTTSDNGKAKRQAEEHNTSKDFPTIAADFYVDDSEIWQLNAWLGQGLSYNHCQGHNGTPNNYRGVFKGMATNYNSIGIETANLANQSVYQIHSSKIIYHKDTKFTKNTVSNLVKLTKALMKEFNIPVYRVVRHHDCDSKSCPGIIGWTTQDGTKSEYEWKAFLKALEPTYDYKDVHEHKKKAIESLK